MLLFLKNFERVRIERIIVVILVFFTAELVVLLWSLILPKRPIYMALLQITCMMGLKYAFIGFDDTGIVAYFRQINI